MKRKATAKAPELVQFIDEGSVAWQVRAHAGTHQRSDVRHDAVVELEFYPEEPEARDPLADNAHLSFFFRRHSNDATGRLSLKDEKQGIQLNVSDLPPLLKALERVVTLAEERGFIPPIELTK